MARLSNCLEEMMMTPLTTAIFATALTVAPLATVQAVEFPIREVEQECQKFGKSTAPDVYQYWKNKCIDDAQQAYDIIKYLWSTLPEKIQTSCISQADMEIWRILAGGNTW